MPDCAGPCMLDRCWWWSATFQVLCHGPGPMERFKIWLGHPYMVGIICPSPRWNRVKLFNMENIIKYNVIVSMVVTWLGWEESQPSLPCSAGSACQCRYRAQPRCLTSTYHLVARASVDDARQLQRLHDCFKPGWGRFFWGPSYLDDLQLKSCNFFSEIERKSPLLVINAFFSLQ